MAKIVKKTVKKASRKIIVPDRVKRKLAPPVETPGGMIIPKGTPDCVKDGVWRGRKLSKYSLALIEWVIKGKGNAILQAKAGSGKTTNLEMVVDILPREARICSIAFNRHIAGELAERMPENVRCVTINALGNSICRNNGAWKFVEKKDELILKSMFNMDDAAERKAFYGVRSSVLRAVMIFKSQAIFATPPRDTIYKLAERFEIEIPAGGDAERWFSYVDAVFTASTEDTVSVDFNDQWYMPLRMEWPMPKFDFVLVDEGQDMSPAQIEFIRRLGGRKLIVGDTHQAIYGFRGADAEAMPKLMAALDAKELPLSICYRCGKNIVKEAQKIVPDIEFWENSPDGEIIQTNHEKYAAIADAGDFVLCRTTAPLVKECLKFIRAGRKAVVRGRDIGRNLADLCRRVGYGKPDLYMAISDYGDAEVGKLVSQKRDAEAQTLEDKIETLLALADGCHKESDQVGFVCRKIESIFSDDVIGITFCTVHRAKGLESDRVFILHPELMPHPMAEQPWQLVQEMNLKYVAITRAMKQLYWVSFPNK